MYYMGLESNLFKNKGSLDRPKEGVTFSSLEQKDKIKKEKVDKLMDKIREKGIQKVHMSYILLYSKLPHDFVQGYFTGDEDYFYNANYDLENLDILDGFVDKFDIEKDEGKMFPTSEVKKQPEVNDPRLN